MEFLFKFIFDLLYYIEKIINIINLFIFKKRNRFIK